MQTIKVDAPKASPFRRSIETKEGQTTLVIFFLLPLLFLGHLNNIRGLSIMICVVLGSFIASRILYKRNRGLFYPSTESGEFWALILNHLWMVLARVFLGLDPLTAAICIGAIQALFNVGRGLSKTVGTKTHILIR